MWFDKKVIVSAEESIPPPEEISTPLKDTSLYLVLKTGSKIAPLPFPPVIETEITLEISNSSGSTKTDLTDPDTTGWTSAFVPTDGLEISIVGGFTTS